MASGTNNVDDFDSGMESQEGSTKEYTPDAKPEIEDNYEEEADETIGERLWGLTEMFPDPVRAASANAAESTKHGAKLLYSFSRSLFWVVFSSSIILFAPIIFEVERAQMEEAQRSQQKQVLLGPTTAVSGPGVPLMPPLHR